jgi:hypothetical protein
VRRALLALAGAAIVVAGLLALLLVFSARDDARLSGADGPGELQPDRGARHLPAGEHVPLEGLTDPPTSGAHHERLVMRDGTTLDPNEIIHALELGNVILFFDGRRPPAALRAVQEDVAGPFDAELAAAGQAVILASRPGSGPVTAAAWRRLLRAEDPADPAVREFAEAWLGRGARG